MEQEFFEAFGIEPKIKYDEFNIDDEKVLMPYQEDPPITPKIVLGLEEIIIDKYYNLTLNKSNDDYPYQYETRDLFTDWCKTQKEALLSLCIGYKDEIQPEVKELFNEQ